MTPVEIALIILITIWSLIFVVIGVLVLVIFLSVKRAMTKVDRILDKTEALADKADLPSKLVTASIVGFMAKNGFGTIKKIIGAFIAAKK
jgi:heme/copper-type cytochrome/quinol oxidase subunit 2